MTRQEANLYLAVILETVAESKSGVPSGHMYAALMGSLSLDQYQGLLGIAKDCGLVEIAKSHLVTLTTKGLEMVAAIQVIKAGVRRPAGFTPKETM